MIRVREIACVEFAVRIKYRMFFSISTKKKILNKLQIKEISEYFILDKLLNGLAHGGIKSTRSIYSLLKILMQL